MKGLLGKMNNKGTVVEVLNGWVLVPRGVDKEKFLKMIRLTALVLVLIPIVAFGMALYYSLTIIISSGGLNVSQLLTVSISSIFLGLIATIVVFLILPNVPWWGGVFFYNALPEIRATRKEKKELSPEGLTELKEAQERRKRAPMFITGQERSLLFSLKDDKDVFEKDLLGILEEAREREA